MPQVEFTSQLAQLADCSARHEVEAGTVSSALDQLCSENEQLRDHILDHQGVIHSHLALFVNGQMIERDKLDTTVGENSEIFVMQALSGG